MMASMAIAQPYHQKALSTQSQPILEDRQLSIMGLPILKFSHNIQELEQTILHKSLLIWAQAIF